MSGEIVVTENDAGGSFHLAAGEVLVFSLPETPTTGYRWEPEPPGSEEFRVVRDEFSPGAMTPGAAGVRTIALRPKHAGQVRVTMALVRAWETGNKPLRRVGVEIEAE